MRKLTDYPDETSATRLVDHLLVAGVESTVRGEAPWEVWVIDEGAMGTARRELEGFSPEASTRRARAASEIRRAKEQLESEGRGATPVELGKSWREGAATRSLGPITLFLIAVSVLVAFQAGFEEPHLDPLIQSLSIEPWGSSDLFARVRAGELWRLLTPMFIHFDLLHIVFNMLWLFQLGREIEHQHGSLVLVGLVVVTQLAGGIGEYLITGPNFGGMSGVVFGLFGFVWMQARYNRRLHYHLEPAVAVFMMLWFVICALGVVGPIANVGHAGGLIVGLLAGSPPYFAQLRSGGGRADLGPGSWARTNLQGRRALVRRYFTPYVPLWFLLIAAVTILFELA